MRAECILAVSQAIGRQINQQEAKDIESRILSGMRQLAREDPAAWAGTSRAGRLMAAAELAGQSLVQQAGKKKQRIALTIIAHDRVMNRYEAGLQEGIRPWDTLRRKSCQVSSILFFHFPTFATVTVATTATLHFGPA
jgi:hypothetical protein